MIPHDVELSVSDFVALLNQTLEFAYPTVSITGELANFRISKNRWVYFDLKDEAASVKFFGTVYHLPGPLEDGMLVKVRGAPRLHPQYGFSVNILTIQPAGEGSLRRAADLLRAKLATEGLFDEARKRPLPYPPARIGLVTSAQSAAYADFMKILAARWDNVDIQLIDVQVQGEAAPEQIVRAIETLNKAAALPEVIVIIRGGGSAEDLAAFNTENVTRAVAASRVPTLVAIGHETDLSLAEQAADQRASTPSNAAELLVPDRAHEKILVESQCQKLNFLIEQLFRRTAESLTTDGQNLADFVLEIFKRAQRNLESQRTALKFLDPKAPLQRGYALVYNQAGVQQRRAKSLKTADKISIEFQDGSAGAVVE
jgi:exodeoxyribonuclease VII large subunit